MKTIQKCLLVLVLGFSSSFVRAESQGPGTRPTGSYAQMQKRVGYPTPKKEQLQKMLQKFVGEFEGRAFKAFSEEDFNRGCLLYHEEDDTNKKPADHVLRAILWHTQNSKIFNKEMRSWYQRYGEKVYAATNAIGMTRDDFLWYYFRHDNGRYDIDWRDTGIIHPYMLRTREAAYVMLNFDRLRSGDASSTGGRDDNVIVIIVKGGKKIELAVTFTAISFPTLR